MNYNHNDNRIIYICKNLHIKRLNIIEIKRNKTEPLDMTCCSVPSYKPCAAHKYLSDICVCVCVSFLHTFANQPKYQVHFALERAYAHTHTHTASHHIGFVPRTAFNDAHNVLFSHLIYVWCVFVFFSSCF